MSIPIVFIHTGDSYYLKYALLQAKLSNPSNKVFLLGDEANRHYSSSQIEHALISYYDEDVELFSRIYRHSSPNGMKFELFCIQRLFILRNFMIKNELKRCCYQDSDVLLYMDVSERNFKSFDILFNHRGLKNLDTLKLLCSMILHHYSIPPLFDRIQQFLKTTDCPGVSDMVLIEYFDSLYENRIHWIGNSIDHAYFCANINLHEDFETINHRKKVYLKNGRLFCKHMPSQQWVPMNSLHFQGDDKVFMEHFFLHNFFYPNNDTYFFDYGSSHWLPV